MTRWAGLVAMGALFLGAAACEPAPLPGEPAPSPDLPGGKPSAAEHGAEIFADPGLSAYSFNTLACDTCHEKHSGDGGEHIRPGAALAGAVQRGSYWGGNEIDLLRAVNDCLRYFMLQDEPWTGKEPEAEAIYAFLEALPATSEDRAPVAFSVAIDLPDPHEGTSAAGAQIYRRACQTCHGEAHTGAGRLVEYSDVLPEDALGHHPLGEYTAEERRLVIVEKVRHGGFLGYAGQMPPFSREKLSDAELDDLIAFFGL
jgi:thiosulfate dehydrogenase